MMSIKWKSFQGTMNHHPKLIPVHIRQEFLLPLVLIECIDTHTYHGSSSAQSVNKKNNSTVDTEQHIETKTMMASTITGIQMDAVEHTPLSVEQVCCCFGCLCTLLCVMMFFMLVIVISK